MIIKKRQLEICNKFLKFFNMHKYTIFTIFVFILSLPIFSESVYNTNFKDINYNTDSLKQRFYEAPGNEQLYGNFKVIDTSTIIVYYKMHKHFRYGEYKKYYYSITKNGRIYELNYENLYVDFNENKKFLELVANSKYLLSKIMKGITYVNYLLKMSL